MPEAEGELSPVELYRLERQKREGLVPLLRPRSRSRSKKNGDTCGVSFRQLIDAYRIDNSSIR